MLYTAVIVFPFSSFIPIIVSLVIGLSNAGMSISFIFILVSSYEFNFGSSSLFSITVYSFSFIFILIDFLFSCVCSVFSCSSSFSFCLFSVTWFSVVEFVLSVFLSSFCFDVCVWGLLVFVFWFGFDCGCWFCAVPPFSVFGFEEGLLGVGVGVGAGVGVGTGVVFAVTEIVFEDDMSVFLPSWVVTSPDTLIFILPVP